MLELEEEVLPTEASRSLVVIVWTCNDPEDVFWHLGLSFTWAAVSWTGAFSPDTDALSTFAWSDGRESGVLDPSLSPWEIWSWFRAFSLEPFLFSGCLDTDSLDNVLELEEEAFSAEVSWSLVKVLRACDVFSEAAKVPFDPPNSDVLPWGFEAPVKELCWFRKAPFAAGCWVP